MAIQSFVTYSITVSPKKSYMMDSDGIQIAQESVDPSDARLHPMVVTLLQDIARDFVFSMGSKFTKTAQATIRFSDREGIIFESSTNDRIQGARESKLKGMVTAISLSDAVRAVGFETRYRGAPGHPVDPPCAAAVLRSEDEVPQPDALLPGRQGSAACRRQRADRRPAPSPRFGVGRATAVDHALGRPATGTSTNRPGSVTAPMVVAHSARLMPVGLRWPGGFPALHGFPAPPQWRFR